jgi:hypothetical protein
MWSSPGIHIVIIRMSFPVTSGREDEYAARIAAADVGSVTVLAR